MKEILLLFLTLSSMAFCATENKVRIRDLKDDQKKPNETDSSKSNRDKSRKLKKSQDKKSELKEEFKRVEDKLSSYLTDLKQKIDEVEKDL